MKYYVFFWLHREARWIRQQILTSCNTVDRFKKENPMYEDWRIKLEPKIEINYEQYCKYK